MGLQTLGVFAALCCSIHVTVYWAPLWGVLRIPSVSCVGTLQGKDKRGIQDCGWEG